MTGLVPNTASAHTISATLLPAPAVIPVAARPSDGLPNARPFLGGDRTTTAVDKSDRSVAGIAVSSGCLIGNGGVAGRETAHRPPPAVIRRPHSVDLGGLGRRPEASTGHSWLKVVPCNRVRPRDCDELPDEFRRAGIGVCFEGREQWVTKRCRLTWLANCAQMRGEGGSWAQPVSTSVQCTQ
jgi:hypothetical protein